MVSKLRLLAFDIEIERSIPEGCQDWFSLGKLGITCASTIASTTDGSTEARLWWGGKSNGCYRNHMHPGEVGDLLAYLRIMSEDGYLVTTWNGTGFDFRVLSMEVEHPALVQQCKQLALGHWDMAFHMYWDMGYMIGLDRMAKSLGLVGKKEGMQGALAPAMWGQCMFRDVLDYVMMDSYNTMAVGRLLDKAAEQGYPIKVYNRGRTEQWLLGGPTTTAEQILDEERYRQLTTAAETGGWSPQKFLGWCTDGDAAVE